MAIIELFSKKQAKQTSLEAEVYVYDTIPETLRNQILYIWDERLGSEQDYGYFNDYEGFSGYETVREAYRFIWNTFRREHGMCKMDTRINYRAALFDYFLECSASHALDIIELSFRIIDNFGRRVDYRGEQHASKEVDAAIQELNDRFKYNGVGYRYGEAQLIRIDSEFTHQGIIKPTLKLLIDPRFAGANEEFIEAHEDYRKGDTKDALHKACKAFESVMKVICSSNGWKYDQNAPASKLIKVLQYNGLIKSYSEDTYRSLLKILENAIPAPRNKEAGHGQGEEIKIIPTHLAGYALNLTAATMLYLVEAEKTLRNSTN